MFVCSSFTLSLLQSLCRKENQCFITKVYSEKIPTTKGLDVPFYFGINHIKSLLTLDILWFKSSAMGVNQLNGLMKTMAEKLGLYEKQRLTYYSVLKTMM